MEQVPGEQLATEITVLFAKGVVTVIATIGKLTGKGVGFTCLAVADLIKKQTHNHRTTGKIQVKTLGRQGENVQEMPFSKGDYKRVKKGMKKGGITFAIEKGARKRSNNFKREDQYYLHVKGKDVDQVQQRLQKLGLQLTNEPERTQAPVTEKASQPARIAPAKNLQKDARARIKATQEKNKKAIAERNQHKRNQARKMGGPKQGGGVKPPKPSAPKLK